MRRLNTIFSLNKATASSATSRKAPNLEGTDMYVNKRPNQPLFQNQDAEDWEAVDTSTLSEAPTFHMPAQPTDADQSGNQDQKEDQDWWYAAPSEPKSASPHISNQNEFSQDEEFQHEPYQDEAYDGPEPLFLDDAPLAVPHTNESQTKRHDQTSHKSQKKHHLSWRQDSAILAQQRQRSVQFRLWRKRASMASLSVFLVTMTLASFWMWHTGRLDLASYQAANSAEQSIASVGLTLDKVEVLGDSRYTEMQDIKRSLWANRGEPILNVDPNLLRERLLALPWVKEARVERQLPSSLVLHIEERQPLAIWVSNQGEKLIDQGGKVIAIEDLSAFSHLPKILGANANEQGPAFLDMLDEVPRLKAKMLAAQLVGDRRWSLKLRNEILLHLPESEPLKALELASSLDQTESLLSRQIHEIDLRLLDRMIIRLPEDAKPLQPFNAADGLTPVAGQGI